ncbi:hypothetical protein FCE95_16990 [Luteimonas gilva]|uniref:Tetratricopeptide repeat protein n=1 Tax=Luteimonas gilva TaxID=2572684 RepID=A0A4U5JNA8_9GAMM|nr:hypothetical protein [Luteimonas gilva]TKR29808.1 hypothetical protein FCE95_16990 [Luteimonas gilva]
MNPYLKWCAPIALLAAGLLAYWAGLHGGFIFDDFANLVEDPDWKMTHLGLDELRRAALNGFAGAGGRPLAILSFAFNHYFTQMDAFALKGTNLGMHLINGCLVLALCTRIFALAPVENARLGRFAAWAVATAWVVHPLQASTVLYVVQRMEIGAAMGTLLALLAYLRARRLQIEGRASLPWFLAAGLAVLFGLGFKESALLAPGYALLLEIFVLRFRVSAGRSKALIGLYAAGIAVALILFVGWALPHYASGAAYAARDFGLGERLLTQAPVLTMYLRQIVAPTPGALLFYYDNFPISGGLFSPPATAVSLAVLAALIASAFLLRRRWPLYALGIGWFFVGHALTSNVVPLELAFEHRNYLALLGILIAIAQIFARIGARLNTDARRTLATAALAGLAALSIIQASTWGEPMRLATALASRNPDSPRAGFELGRLLLQQSGGDPSSAQWFLAHKEFEHAAFLPRSSPLAEQALIIMDSRLRRPVPQDIWRSFQRKFRERAIGPEGLNALHGVLACRQRDECHFEDRDLYDTFAIALTVNPDSAIVHSLYATFAFNIMRDHELGIRVMRDAVRLAPNDAQYKANLAQLLAASGDASPELDALIAQVNAANGKGTYTDVLRQIQALRRNAARPVPTGSPAR